MTKQRANYLRKLAAEKQHCKWHKERAAQFRARAEVGRGILAEMYDTPESTLEQMRVAIEQDELLAMEHEELDVKLGHVHV
jgi:hypothetical protein